MNLADSQQRPICTESAVASAREVASLQCLLPVRCLKTQGRNHRPDGFPPFDCPLFRTSGGPVTLEKLAGRELHNLNGRFSCPFEGVWRSGSVDPRIIDLSTSWGIFQVHNPSALARGK
jgi:hypothetical protein